MIIRNEAYIKVGGFDPIFFLYYEEADLCWRMWKSGYKVVLIPYVVAYHVGGSSVRSLNQADLITLYFLERNRIITLFKNYTYKELHYFLLALLLGLGSVMKKLLKGQRIQALVHLKALIAGLTKLRYVRRSMESNKLLFERGLIPRHLMR